MKFLLLLPALAIFLSLVSTTTFAHQGQPTGVTQAHDHVHSTNFVSITIEGGSRIIHANGIPDHATGAFPNRNNPNRIAPQDQTFRVPLKPVPATSPSRLGMHPFGVALNGVVFDPAAAEWWNRDRSSGWQYEPMHMEGRLGADENNAHVQPSGSYHYHAVPTGLLEKLNGEKPKMTQLGWAADGFPIYSPWAYVKAKDTNTILKKLLSSYRIKKGTRASGPGGPFDGTYVADFEYVKGAGDLDECNGRHGVTPEFPGGTYYYVLTEDFPYIPRFFAGTPDPSFFRKGPPPFRTGAEERPRRGPFGEQISHHPEQPTNTHGGAHSNRTAAAKGKL